MTTFTVLFAIVGFIAAVVFATKKVIAVKDKVLDKLDERLEKKELEVLAHNKNRFKNWEFYAGDVRATIVDYQWTMIRLENSDKVYTSYHEFIETEYRQYARVTEFEYHHLSITEEALRDCRAGRILAKDEEEVVEVKRATIIETDDYGKLVKYAPNQLVNIAGTKRMAAFITESETGDVFIKELHVTKKGFSNTSSVTIYPIADEHGNRNKEWSHAFQVNVESNKEEWEEEILALNELKETLAHWNTHRHLVSFNTDNGMWVVMPKLPVVEEPAQEKATQTPEEAALDAICNLSQEQLDELTKVLAESSGYTRPAVQEAAATN